MTTTPLTDALHVALLGVSDALDDVKDSGLPVPPMAVQGAATLNVALMVLRGMELERAGVPTSADDMLAAAASQLGGPVDGGLMKLLAQARPGASFGL